MICQKFQQSLQQVLKYLKQLLLMLFFQRDSPTIASNTPSGISQSKSHKTGLRLKATVKSLIEIAIVEELIIF